MTLAQDLLLVAISPRTRRIRVIGRIGIALRAAELLDLALAGRVTVADRRIAVADPSPPGHPALDRALAELQDRNPAPLLDEWLRSWPPSTGPGLIRQYLTLLEQQDAVRVEQRGADAAIRTRIFVVDEPRYALVLARIGRVAGADSAATAQDVALAALVRACRLDRALFRGPQGWRTRRRLGRLARQTEHTAITEETRAAIAFDSAARPAGIKRPPDNLPWLTGQMAQHVRHSPPSGNADGVGGHGTTGSGHQGGHNTGSGGGHHGGEFGGGGGHH